MFCQNWVSISAQQKHGSSVVEVYRIVEEVRMLSYPELSFSVFTENRKAEYHVSSLVFLTIEFNGTITKLSWEATYHFCLQTVDQFFGLKVPMRPGELSSLFRGIDNAFQVYTKHVLDSIGNVFMSDAKMMFQFLFIWNWSFIQTTAWIMLISTKLQYLNLYTRMMIILHYWIFLKILMVTVIHI